MPIGNSSPHATKGLLLLPLMRSSIRQENQANEIPCQRRRLVKSEAWTNSGHVMLGAAALHPWRCNAPLELCSAQKGDFQVDRGNSDVAELQQFQWTFSSRQ
ncbi:MAG: hypothetical protein Q9157_007378 [Trypethelium eluteriae]